MAEETYSVYTETCPGNSKQNVTNFFVVSEVLYLGLVNIGEGQLMAKEYDKKIAETFVHLFTISDFGNG